MTQGTARRKAEAALERARRGQGVSGEEALGLAETTSLDELLATAGDLREKGKGRAVSYSKKVFIPLTTLCRDYCSYCTFRKDPGQPGAHFMTPDEVLAMAEEGMRAGLPHANAPDKVPSLRLRTIEEAGKRSIAFTTGILIGIGETMEERIDSLLAIRKMHEKYGHIQEVIVQNFRAKPQIPMAHHVEPSLEEMLRTLAVARLILGAEMNLQAPPNLSYEDFPRLLDAGINDWGGISPVTKDFINPEAAWPQISKLQEETEARGFVLRERLALYPEFVAREHFVSARVRQKMNALAAADGFAAQ